MAIVSALLLDGGSIKLKGTAGPRPGLRSTLREKGCSKCDPPSTNPRVTRVFPVLRECERQAKPLISACRSHKDAGRNEWI
jgi:hypothetical protein